MTNSYKVKLLAWLIVTMATGNVLYHVNYGFSTERSIMHMREQDQLAEQSKLSAEENNYKESLNSTYSGTILRISGFPRDIK